MHDPFLHKGKRQKATLHYGLKENMPNNYKLQLAIKNTVWRATFMSRGLPDRGDTDS